MGLVMTKGLRLAGMIPLGGSFLYGRWDDCGRGSSYPLAGEGIAMTHIIKIKCNGVGQHLNRVDLDSALEEAVVYRGADIRLQDLPDSGVTLRCRVCAEGRIVITRQMIIEMLGEDHE
jgi:hypothetical protein